MKIDTDSSVVKVFFKKIKNKPHTILMNIDADKKEDILKTLRKLFGCGGSIDEQGNVSLQGNHITKIMDKKEKYLPGMDVTKIDG